MPIFNSKNFDFYHLYPIPQKNLTIIPPNPFLILGSHRHQYEDQECHLTEDIHICVDKLILNQENDCVISCIQNTNVQNCRATSVHFSNPIVTQISDNYALIIPSTKALRIKKTCEHPGYLLIDKPSLIKIPQHCDISGDSFRFSNKDDLIIGQPFLLHEIPLGGANEPPIHSGNIHLDNIHLDEISKIQAEASHLHPTPPVHYQAHMTSTLLSVESGKYAAKFWEI
ncbi:hypothetical protein Zmor_024234 [Zophobas morio]|uniref:Uncharacterized protein n=1 Tax=Zophobas morio TaxID=2755281 RepID=A0AA38M7X2_9CUCU|nr:hypothetical protein Zmor_024234 [Zophobas morio]